MRLLWRRSSQAECLPVQGFLLRSHPAERFPAARQLQAQGASQVITNTMHRVQRGKGVLENVLHMSPIGAYRSGSFRTKIVVDLLCVFCGKRFAAFGALDC